MTISATPPSLIDGLRPIDRSFESWWVRPGSATAVELHAGDRVTIRDPGRRPAGRAHALPDVARHTAQDAPATVLRNLGEEGFLRSVHREGLRPEEARAALLFGADSPPGAAEAFDGGSGRAAGGGRSGRPPGGRGPARLRARHRDQAPDAAQAGRGAAARAARRAAARLPRGPRQRARLRGEGGRVHPDHRRAGPPVLGLPRLPPREAREAGSSAAWTG